MDMSNEWMSSTPPLVMNWKPEGKNKRGRPWEWREDEVMRDMAKNGMDEEVTQDKKEIKDEGSVLFKKKHWGISLKK